MPLSDWPTGVFSKFCAWDGSVEKYLRACAGDEMFNQVLEATKSQFGIDRSDCFKTPAIASTCLFRWVKAGVKFPELAKLVDAIDEVLKPQ